MSSAASPKRGASRDSIVGVVLVVDDSEANRELLVRRLRRQGHEIVEADGGNAALARVRERAFDLVLLDVMMPDLSGPEVLAALKEGEATRHVPVIMISASQEMDTVVRCIELGAEDYLPKPFDPVLLKARIGASLQRKRFHDAEQAYRREIERANAELREAQARVVQSEKMSALGRLVAGLAHELNTPLGAMRSLTATQAAAVARLGAAIEAKVPEQERGDVLRFLRIVDQGRTVIEQAAERITSVVDRMRHFARLDEAEFVLTDLHRSLDDALALMRHELEGRIEVRREYGPLPSIHCWSNRLNQVFVGVLHNAVEAITGPGLVVVSTELVGGEVHVRIRDDGCGISEAHLPRIMDPGFTTKGVGVGSGLGLAIAWQVLRDHQGRIHVESEVGRGTTVELVLPTDLAERAAATADRQG